MDLSEELGGNKGGQREEEEEDWELERRKHPLSTARTAKGRCLNHLKLQRHGSVTVASGNRVYLLACVTHHGPSLLPPTPPALTFNCLRVWRRCVAVEKCLSTREKVRKEVTRQTEEEFSKVWSKSIIEMGVAHTHTRTHTHTYRIFTSSGDI